MDVVVPFTKRYPRVKKALDATGYPYRFVDVSGSETAYWELFEELWGVGRTFVIVEHDIIVNPSSLRAMERCWSAWCSLNYEWASYGWVADLGCAKFDAELMKEFPNLMESARQRAVCDETSAFIPRHWATLGAKVGISLMDCGALRCRFHKPVTQWRGGSHWLLPESRAELHRQAAAGVSPLPQRPVFDGPVRGMTFADHRAARVLYTAQGSEVLPAPPPKPIRDIRNWQLRTDWTGRLNEASQ